MENETHANRESIWQANFGGQFSSPLSPDVLQRTRSEKRRFNRDPENLPAQVAIKMTGILLPSLRKEVPKWNQNAEAFPLVEDRTFKGPPSVYGFAEALREIPDFLNQLKEVEGGFAANPAIVADLQGTNFFETKLNGTSLLDIEGMQLPLSNKDIQRIHGMFPIGMAIPGASKIFKMPSMEDKIVLQMMVLLAARKFVDPKEKIKVPEKIMHLHSRLVNYFDHWVELTLNPPESAKAEYMEYISPTMVSQDLFWAIGTYLPARLGILPSSAIKLYIERVSRSKLSPDVGLAGLFFKNAFWRPFFLPGLSVPTRKAIRTHALPFDLQKYQNYDFETDKRASAILAKRYSQELANIDLTTTHEAASRFRDRLSLYRESLQADILSSGSKRRLVVNMDDESVEKLILTSQNKDTLMMILDFKDNENTHLTLEFTKDERLFGFPVEMLKEKGLTDLVTADMLQPLLERAQYLHPSVEPIVPSIKVTREEEINQVPEPIITEFRPRKPQNGREKWRPSKTPTAVTPIQEILQSAGVKSEVVKPQQLRKLVFLSNPDPDEDTIEQFIRESARQLPGNDREAIFRDVQATVASLLEDPYGPGIEKLKPGRETWISIPTPKGDRRVLKWHYRADRRIDLEGGEESKRVRVMYVPMGNEVLLLEIIHHNEFDTKYGK